MEKLEEDAFSFSRMYNSPISPMLPFVPRDKRSLHADCVRNVCVFLISLRFFDASRRCDSFASTTLRFDASFLFSLF